jgi:ABC-2 type transport system ATP-binding protein
VPDQPFLYEPLTIDELLWFLGTLYELGRDGLGRRIDEWLERFELAAYRRRRIGQLSYGLKSRLVLVATLLHAPKALLLDEPFFGLDPPTLRLARRVLTEQVRDGAAVLLSTHQLAVVEGLADRVAILRQGRVVDIGTLPELGARHGAVPLEELFFRLAGPESAEG